MRNLMAAFLFVVSWSEYKLVPTIDFRGWAGDPYTVETVEHSIKLKTRKDVDLFLGTNQWNFDDTGKSLIFVDEMKHGAIGDKAFNIGVREDKEPK